MSLIDKDFILEETPFFADLSAVERQIVKEYSTLLEVKKGQVIYYEGSGPSAFYCIAIGRVVIYTHNQQGEKTVLEYLHRGRYFGIISLLTNEPHSVTAEALNDCLLLVIKKDDFDLVLKKIPLLAIDLSQTLSRRLKRRDLHQKTIFESTIISVFSSYSQAGKTLYALNLALSLKKETRKSVVVLDIAPIEKKHSLPRKIGINDPLVFDLSAYTVEDPKALKEVILKNDFGVDLVCFHYKPDDEGSFNKLLRLLTYLVNDYHYLILDLPSIMDRSVFNILNQSDTIHLLSGPDEVEIRRTHNLIERLKSEFNFNPDKIKIIINEYKLSKLPHELKVRLLGKELFATLPKVDFESSDRLILDEPDCEYSRAVRRIARTVGDCRVGLVLGVGVAYGFCHVGVLKVIEEEKIPIDVIVGSSIGSVIAALWVTGKSSREILAVTREFKEPKHIWGLMDLTFPRLGFIKGNKLHRFLKRHLGAKTFYDIKLPLKIVASDVKKKETRIFDKGLLLDAVMASCSMPGVFTPFRFKDQMLFDGGVINPLPTEPMLKMGIKKILAVNVTPSREDVLGQYEKLKTNLTVKIPEDIKRRHWFGLKRDVKDTFKTNILDIIFSSFEVMQSEVAKREAEFADVVLHPDTSGLYWLELHKAREFAKRGEDEARKNLGKIWQMVNE